MNSARKNILITGFPGIGKTTLIKSLFEKLKHLNPAGFYTAEIREDGIRKGFELESFDGRKGILSHIDIKSLFRVGRYKVNIDGFEDFLDSIAFFNNETNLIIIDEIGKMECLSKIFRKLLKEILDSEKTVIATIALKSSGFIEEIKKQQDVRLFEITLKNRDTLLTEILNSINDC